ncbi:MAG: class I SAM-dependent methyltransferase [Patescibacteria group bacterium]|nr:class I SAM-dependent methyltransferase [Patescibacteria group bacterium]
MKEEIALKILAKNKELYNDIASDFSRTRGAVWPEFEYFKGYIANGQDILDLGCGNGRLLELLKEYQINYLGIDYSQKLIGQAQRLWPDSKFLVADILNLPPLKKKFDLIFCVAVLHHIPSKKFRLQVLKEMKNLLKPGGKLLMINWNLWQTRYLKYIIKYTLLKMTDPLNEANGIKHMNLDLGDVFIPWQKKHLRYVHAFTEMEVESLLKKSGFEIIKNVSNNRNIITVAKVK